MVDLEYIKIVDAEWQHQIEGTNVGHHMEGL